MFLKKTKFFVALLFTLYSIGSGAQNEESEKLPVEKVILTTDRTIYFAGEKIWFRANCLIPSSSDSLSRVMYVELLDKKASPVIQKKFQIINGISTNAIDIQEDISTGNYYIRAYTQYMRNLERESFYTTELTIINPDLDPKEGIQTIVKDSSINAETTNNAFKINLPATVFLPGGIIEFELSGKGKEQVSVSVVKKGSYEPNKVGINKYYKISADKDTLKKLKWYPEIRSVSISGKVLDKQNGQPLKDMPVYASIIDSVKQFHVTKTNTEGAFVFTLINLHNNHQVYIGTEQDATVLVNPDFASGLPTADYTTFKIDDAKQILINEMYMNHQVTSVYKNETATTKNYLDTLPDPFQSSGETIFFKDYIALPTMMEMFNEIIPYTKIKVRKEGAVIQLSDKKDKVFFENPLVLLDNIPFHDHDALLTIPPSRINSVNVIPTYYVYGREIINGIINIKSKEGNLAGLPLPKDISVLDYTTYNPSVNATFDKSTGFSANKPGFKNTLYWNPRVDIKSGKQTIQFSAGDEITDYDIVVRGVDKKGNTVTELKTISVVKPQK